MSLSHVQLFVTMNCTVHGILQARILEWVTFPFSRDLPNTGIKSRSPTLQVDSLPAEPQGKPKNTGVGSLLHLQGIFLTQESNWGFLHCRQILYQLSYQGSSSSVLEWVAMPSSRGSSQPRDRTQVGLPRCRQMTYCLRHQEGPICQNLLSNSSFRLRHTQWETSL